MEELFINLIEQQPVIVYLAVYGVLFACGLGLPIPEDITLVAGGYAVYVAQQRGLTSPDLWPMIIVGLVGVLTGDVILFFVGRRLGPRVTKVWPFRRLVSEKRLHRVQRFFRKYGAGTAFIARFAPGLRSPTFLIAGTAGMRFRIFILADGVAALISAPLFVALAYHFGDQIDRVKYWLEQSRFAIVFVLLFIAGVIGVKLLIRYYQRKREEAEPESP